MDKLPVEIKCKIVSYFDAPDLLVFRLVCLTFRNIVDNHLARVNHVKVNQHALNDSPIPNILFDKLNVLNFDCPVENFSLLFSFIAAKCPNLQLLSSTTSTIDAKYLVKLQNELRYFEVEFIEGEERNRLVNLTSLIAADCYCFCSCNLNSRVQFSNTCQNSYEARKEHQRVKDMSPVQRQSLRWFDHESEEETSLELPDCPSLEILRIECSQGFDKLTRFAYPKLKYIRLSNFDFDEFELEPVIKFLQRSPQLKAIEIDPLMKEQAFLQFTSSLGHLRFLKIVNHESDEPISIPLNKNLEYFWLETGGSLSFADPFHEKLQSVRLCSQISNPLTFNFPSLKEASLQFTYDSKLPEGAIESLEQSPNLKRVEMFFDELVTSELVGRITTLISRLTKLRKIYIRCNLEDRVSSEIGNPCFDISQHFELQKFTIEFTSYDMESPTFYFYLGQLPFNLLVYKSHDFILKRIQSIYHSCVIRSLYSPVEFISGEQLQITSPMVPDAIEELQMTLSPRDFINVVEYFSHFISESPNLKRVSLNVSEGPSYFVPSNDLTRVLDAVSKRSSLELLEMDLSMDSTENLVIDTTLMPCLRKLVFKMRPHKVKLHKMKVILKLGDDYKRLTFDGEDSLKAERIDEAQMEFSLPANREVVLTDPMSNLKFLSITDWNLVEDTKDLFKVCTSIESLHMNGGDHDRSTLIPVLTTYPHLRNLSGRLSHTFLKMLLNRLKGPRELNIDLALKPVVEKIQEKINLQHLKISWLES